MPNLDEQVQAIDVETLTPIVHRATQSLTAEVLDWSSAKIEFDYEKPAGGLYRISGHLSENNQKKPWSVILKILQWTDTTASLGQDYLGDPASIFYWKREALFFRSELLHGWTGGFRPVQCYAVLDTTADTTWLWLEDLREAGANPWSLERHILAARHFGEFNGATIGADVTDAHAWLSKGFLRQWLPVFNSLGLDELIQNPGVWNHPYVRQAFPVPIADRLIRHLTENSHLLNVLDHCPQTISHLDTDRRNLFSRQTPEGQEQTIVIDWAFMGLAAVGEDLGNQVLGNLFHLVVAVADAQQYQTAALNAYIKGLRAKKWQDDVQQVYFTSKSHAVHYLSLVPYMISGYLSQGNLPAWAQRWSAERGLTVDKTLESWGEAIYYLLDVADEAQYLAGQIDVQV